MVIPLYDDNPFERTKLPLVTWGLIVVNVIVFIIELGTTGVDRIDSMSLAWGVVPADIMHAFDTITPWRTCATLVTATFVHAGWEHIIGNMIFLSVFGDDIELALGRFRFLVFYLLVGVVANLGYVVVNANSTTPLVGASGAISGVLAAYLMLRPCAYITALVFVRIARIQAFWVIGLWIAIQFYRIVTNEQDDVAYLAHLGGLVAGGALFALMKPRDVTLFECIPQPGEETPNEETAETAVSDKSAMEEYRWLRDLPAPSQARETRDKSRSAGPMRKPRNLR
jgi:membrane associated rhomboid family serine protease